MIGILEYWNNGILEYWSIGRLSRRDAYGRILESLILFSQEYLSNSK
jgi:hypothetical protein